jgi:hypothetical protein
VSLITRIDSTPEFKCLQYIFTYSGSNITHTSDTINMSDSTFFGWLYLISEFFRNWVFNMVVDPEISEGGEGPLTCELAKNT